MEIQCHCLFKLLPPNFQQIDSLLKLNQPQSKMDLNPKLTMSYMNARNKRKTSPQKPPDKKVIFLGGRGSQPCFLLPPFKSEKYYSRKLFENLLVVWGCLHLNYPQTTRMILLHILHIYSLSIWPGKLFSWKQNENLNCHRCYHFLFFQGLISSIAGQDKL